ncbi:MAG TPA: hypothetical protein VFH51_04455 [Myxococcota bacterium]|nr:hypothetical protein [Myxococcota bacterium]
MVIELNEHELAVLQRVLDRQVHLTREELAHTEAPRLRRALAADLEEVERLTQQLSAETAAGAPAVDAHPPI